VGSISGNDRGPAHHRKTISFSASQALHGQQAQVVPLLEALLLQAPSDAELRLRLADALHNLGRFAEADTHYRWLLEHPTSGIPKSPALTAGSGPTL
jgi:hypothetical protein